MTTSWNEITTSRTDTGDRRAAYEHGRREAVAEIVAYDVAELRKLRSELPRQLLGSPSPRDLERLEDDPFRPLK